MDVASVRAVYVEAKQPLPSKPAKPPAPKKAKRTSVAPAPLSPEDAAKLESFVVLAERKRMALVVYQKPDEATPTRRLVEPYDMVGNKGMGVSAVRCWQIQPAVTDGPSWRCFRLDRIVSVTDGGRGYTPRRHMSLITGEITRFDIRGNPWRSRHQTSHGGGLLAGVMKFMLRWLGGK